ncbi:MAG TPA: hypothetical protein VMV49_10515 [Candidatus Deferrimicrobium sp.]|nr:hypothetical protein [Candidatus Deferrimicrobium sp.]
METKKKIKIFAICSTYRRDTRPVCAFLDKKTEQTIEDMKMVRADALLWSALGSGMAGLPLIQLEAEGKQPWSSHKGIGDTEFIKRCKNEGIKVFAVLWEAHGYRHIPIVVSESGKIITWMGHKKPKKSKGIKTYYGLDEFCTGTAPQLGKWEDFFDIPPPKGFIDETACRSIYNTKPWLLWILPHLNGPYSTFAQCRNSPLWRTYLKRAIELQIDAGAEGIQFDESAIPWDFIWLGAGYCKHCNAVLIKYLKTESPDLYQKYVKSNGFELRRLLLRHFKSLLTAHVLIKHFPLWREFRLAMIRSAAETFGELAKHARDYGKNLKKNIEITGNFAEMLPFYIPLIKYVDFIALEHSFNLPPKTNHPLYRLTTAFAGSKPVTIVSAVVSSFLLSRWKKTNLLYFYIWEAIMANANFMVPYSCYTAISRPYYPPLEPFKLSHDYVLEHEWAFHNPQTSRVALLFSYPTHQWTFNFLNVPFFPSLHYRHYEIIANSLASAKIPYKVITLGDSKQVPEFSEDPEPFDLIISPGCEYLTEIQRERLMNLRLNNQAVFLGRTGKYDERANKTKALPQDKPSGVIKHLKNKGVAGEFYVKDGEKIVISTAETEKYKFFYFLNMDYNRKNDTFLEKQIAFTIKNKNISNTALLLRPNQEDEQIKSVIISNKLVFQFRLSFFAALCIEK